MLVEVLDPRPKSRIQIKLPDATYNEYAKQAAAQKRDVDEVITDRLTRCVEHTASRPLYFNTEQRQELEKLLGGKMLGSPEAAIYRIRQALRVTVGDVEIPLDAGTLELFKSRMARGQNITDELRHLITSWISRYLTGEI